MLNLVLQVVILVKMNSFILVNILYLFLTLICLIYKHYVFGNQMIFLGHLVSLFLNKTQLISILINFYRILVNMYLIKSLSVQFIMNSYRKLLCPSHILSLLLLGYHLVVLAVEEYRERICIS